MDFNNRISIPLHDISRADKNITICSLSGFRAGYKTSYLHLPYEYHDLKQAIDLLFINPQSEIKSTDSTVEQWMNEIERCIMNPNDNPVVFADKSYVYFSFLSTKYIYEAFNVSPLLSMEGFFDRWRSTSYRICEICDFDNRLCYSIGKKHIVCYGCCTVAEFCFSNMCQQAIAVFHFDLPVELQREIMNWMYLVTHRV